MRARHALQVYEQKLSKQFSIAESLQDPAIQREFSSLKGDLITNFTIALTRLVNQFRPGIKSSRNIFASALLDSDSQTYLAQDFQTYLESYDYVALMAMPQLEGVEDADQFFTSLLEQFQKYPGQSSRLFSNCKPSTGKTRVKLIQPLLLIHSAVF